MNRDEPSTHDDRSELTGSGDLALLRAHDPASDLYPDPASSAGRDTLARAMASQTATSTGSPTSTAPRTPGRWLAAGMAVAIAAVVLTVVIGLVPTTSGRAYAIRELPGGLLELQTFPELRDGDALATELGEYGIDAVVETTPTSPSLVGQVAVLDGDDRVAANVPGLYPGEEGTDEAFVLDVDPDVFTGTLIIEVYVEPDPGQAYVTSEEVFAPGEVLGGLHCVLGEPISVADLIPYLDQVDQTPVWGVVTPTDRPDTTDWEVVDTPPPGIILRGHAIDDSTVELAVQPDGVELPQEDGLELAGADVPCTPEQAAPWE